MEIPLPPPDAKGWLASTHNDMTREHLVASGSLWNRALGSDWIP